MMWYDTLVVFLKEHLEETHHFTEYGPEEIRYLEEHLHYTSFAHAEVHSISCPFIDCKFRRHFTVNYDLLVMELEVKE
jgi:hypothetical protein